MIPPAAFTAAAPILAAWGIHGWDTVLVWTPVITPNLMGVPLGAPPVLPAPPPAAVAAVLPALVVGVELLDLDELLHAAATSTSPNKATIHTLRICMAPPLPRPRDRTGCTKCSE
jgi:hypothetical protein